MNEFTRKTYEYYKRLLRDCEDHFDVLKFIAMMLIEIWWNTKK